MAAGRRPNPHVAAHPALRRRMADTLALLDTLHAADGRELGVGDSQVQELLALLRRHALIESLFIHPASRPWRPVPGGPPDWLPAARLTRGRSRVTTALYADADAMLKLFRTGKRADGSAEKVMPFEALSKMSETDVRALHLYLCSIRVVGDGGADPAPAPPKMR